MPPTQNWGGVQQRAPQGKLFVGQSFVGMGMVVVVVVGVVGMMTVAHWLGAMQISEPWQQMVPQEVWPRKGSQVSKGVGVVMVVVEVEVMRGMKVVIVVVMVTRSVAM